MHYTPPFLPSHILNYHNFKITRLKLLIDRSSRHFQQIILNLKSWFLHILYFIRYHLVDRAPENTKIGNYCSRRENKCLVMLIAV